MNTIRHLFFLLGLLLLSNDLLADVTIREIPTTQPHRDARPIQIESIRTSNEISVKEASKPMIALQFRITDPDGYIVTTPRLLLKQAKDNNGNSITLSTDRLNDENWSGQLNREMCSYSELYGIDEKSKSITINGELVYRKAIRMQELTIRPVSEPQKLEIMGLPVELSKPERYESGWRYTFKSKRPPEMSEPNFKLITAQICAINLQVKSDRGITYESGGGGAELGLKEFSCFHNYKPRETPSDRLNPPAPDEITFRIIPETVEVHLPLESITIELP